MEIVRDRRLAQEVEPERYQKLAEKWRPVLQKFSTKFLLGESTDPLHNEVHMFLDFVEDLEIQGFKLSTIAMIVASYMRSHQPKSYIHQ
jgi:hypothetical protein